MRKLLKYQEPATRIPFGPFLSTPQEWRTDVDTQKQLSIDNFSANLEKQRKAQIKAEEERRKQASLGGLTGFAEGRGNNLMSAAGGLFSGVNQSIFQNSESNRTASDAQAADIRTSISDTMLKSGNPYVMAAGLATKVVDGAIDATGLRSTQITKSAQEKAGISGAARFLNNSMNFLPGNPLALGGKKIADSDMSMETEQIRGAYADALSDMDAAQTMGGGRVNFMLSGKTRNKMNDFVTQQNRRNEILTNISTTNTLRKQSDYAQELNNQNFNRYTGNSYQNTAVGKEGLKLPDKEMLKAIYASRKSEVSAFKEGGVIGVDTNVIPEGALHKELNHMEDYNKELDKVITDKGVAVVTTDENRNVEQVAEVEKEELIYSKSVTERLEELWRKWKESTDVEEKNKLCLEAGKFLTKETLTNTDDLAQIMNTEEKVNGND